MTKRLYVGNLLWGVVEDELREQFSEVGGVEKVEIVRDQQGRSRGFAFVDMVTVEEAERAVAELDGKILHGREMRVSAARERESRRDRNRERADHAPPGLRRWA